MDEALEPIKISLYDGDREVFSGQIEELPTFLSREQTADRAVAYDKAGRASVSMKYQDLLSLIGTEE